MEIKVIRVYLTGSKRIHELYEENQRFLQKQEELRKAVRAQDRQMKGYGKDFEKLLREREALREKIETIKENYDEVRSERDEWERRYRESEKARKSLGEKLEHAVGALELLKEREGKDNPTVRCADTSPCTGEVRAAGGIATREERATNKALLGPYGEHGAAERPKEGGLRI